MKSFEYDEIGRWSEIKLDILRKYSSAYSTIISKQALIKKHIYIDAFAGAGIHISRTTGDLVKGSPLNALEVKTPFNEYYLIDSDSKKIAELERIVGLRSDVFIYQGDANRILVEKVFPKCQYTDYHRALCFLDPYSLDIDWSVVETAGEMNSIEIFYNFMIMDANMNMLWSNPDKVPEKQAERFDRVWGDRTWRKVAYKPQPTLFDGIIDIKAGNEVVANAFRERLQEVAKFKFVPKPIPMRNGKGVVIYYLYFASQYEAGGRIVTNIFDSYRNKGIK